MLLDVVPSRILQEKKGGGDMTLTVHVLVVMMAAYLLSSVVIGEMESGVSKVRSASLRALSVVSSLVTVLQVMTEFSKAVERKREGGRERDGERGRREREREREGGEGGRGEGGRKRRREDEGER